MIRQVCTPDDAADDEIVLQSLYRGMIAVFRPMTGRQLISEVAEKHGLTFADLAGPRRMRKFVLARQEAMWLVRRRTKLSTTQIGRLLGHRDHSTVMWGIRAHEARLAPAEAAA